MKTWKKELVIDHPDLPNPELEENGLVTAFIEPDEVTITINEDEGDEGQVYWDKNELLEYLLTKLGYKTSSWLQYH